MRLCSTRSHHLTVSDEDDRCERPGVPRRPDVVGAHYVLAFLMLREGRPAEAVKPGVFLDHPGGLKPSGTRPRKRALADLRAQASRHRARRMWI